MKIKKYIYFFLAVASAMSSCKKSFLELTPSTAVTASTAISTENDMADAVNGMYVAMKYYTLFGRELPVLGDIFADNTYVSTSNSGRFLLEYQGTLTSSSTDPSNIWNQAYYTILQANRIINNTTVASSSNVLQLKGEAYTVRALTYLELVNWYATPYTVNSAAAGVPLVTNVNYTAAAALVKPARSTVAQVYAKIISDLDSAYAIMPTAGTTLHSINSNYIAKYAAKAVESRAYLYMGDYANARDAALLVTANGGYSLATTSTAFTSYWANPGAISTKQETIFELNNSLTSSNGTNGLDYIYSQSGYGDVLCTTDLYNSYTSTDYRRSLILNTTRASVQAYVVNKYSNISSSSDRDDIKVIRYAEVLLTLAESYARLGDNVNALVYLNMVATARDPSLVAYTSTGTTTITNILNERRKELAFEGLRYFDLTRTNVVVTHPTQTYASPSFGTLPVGDYRRILPIPLAEINANPNITQNTGY